MQISWPLVSQDCGDLFFLSCFYHIILFLPKKISQKIWLKYGPSALQTRKHSKCLKMRPHLTLFSIAVNCSFVRARTNLHLHLQLYHSVCSDLDLNSLYSGQSGSDPHWPRPDQDVTLHYHIALSLHLSFFLFLSVCVSVPPVNSLIVTSCQALQRQLCILPFTV